MGLKVSLRYYDAKNLGDDLFVRVVTERYSNIFLVSPALKRRSFSKEQNVRRGESLFVHIFRKVVRKITGGFPVYPRYYLHGDVHLYIGGSIFIEGDDLNRWYRERRFYQKMNSSYYILGSNVGPYNSEDFLNIAKDIIVGSADTCLRDSSSFRAVQDLPTVRLSTDVVFNLNPSGYGSKRGKVAVISLIDGYEKFDRRITQKYESALVSIVAKLVNDGYRVVFMSFCEYEGDERAAARVINGVDEKYQGEVSTYMYDGDLDEALGVLAGSELIIGSRFHANILGLVFGKKVLPMAYSDKTINILKDMDFQGPVIDIRKIDEFDAGSFDFGSLVINDVSEQVKLAETQFQELDKVLERRG